MLALVEQKVGSRLGNANPTIYALGNSATYYNSASGSVFHDVTTGNNDNPCTAGTIDCPNGGTIGFNAGVGYDLATGWGSVDLYNLASDWTQGDAARHRIARVKHLCHRSHRFVNLSRRRYQRHLHCDRDRLRRTPDRDRAVPGE